MPPRPVPSRRSTDVEVGPRKELEGPVPPGPADAMEAVPPSVGLARVEGGPAGGRWAARVPPVVVGLTTPCPP